jgi:transcriptional regulator
MYIPEPFKEDRIDVLHDAIRRAGLAILISLTSDGLIASHISLLLDPEPAPYGTLQGHLARPNPEARGAVGDALAIFLGPDSYITPSWYPSKRETGRSYRPGTMSLSTPTGLWNLSTIPTTLGATLPSLPADLSTIDPSPGHPATHPRITSRVWSGELSAFN